MPQPSVSQAPRLRSERRRRLSSENLQPAPAIGGAPGPAVLRTPAAARHTGLSESYLEKLRIVGTGPPFLRLAPRAVGYLVADLDRWLAERRCMSTSAPAYEE